MAVGTPSRSLFWIRLLGLVVFVIAFGTPFLRAYTSGKVVVWFGCSPAALDGQAVCPPGSLATRFTPLTHWIGSLLAPVLFVRQFVGCCLDGVCWDWWWARGRDAPLAVTASRPRAETMPSASGVA